ncbi:putative oxalocrotonate tautomerase [Bisporella sp. PMI_857]|nr:putative oxalocrotonate tautomerase [Bisporella sp. PMI_857]
MPKWVFHHTAGSFTAEEKRRIAQGMTKIYIGVGLPAFYCHTHFIELQPENIYAGGENPSALTTVSIYHVARSFDTKEIQDMFFQGLDDVLRPILKPKGIEWESAIYEGSLEYWRINGLIPPAMGSDLEKKWAKENRVTDEEELLRNQTGP